MLLGEGVRPSADVIADCLIASAIDGLAPFFLILTTNISSGAPKQLTWRRSVLSRVLRARGEVWCEKNPSGIASTPFSKPRSGFNGFLSSA
jgi:hypothetical protein